MESSLFLRDARLAGVDGLIVVDCPPEEDDELCEPARNAGLAFIRLATPTTDDVRLAAVLANTSGFVYYVSITGVTGAATPDAKAVGQAVARIKRHTPLPVAVGFGVKDSSSAAVIAATADGVVVGSALVEAVRQSLADGRASPTTVLAVTSSSRRSRAGVRNEEKRSSDQLKKRRNMNWISNVVPPKIRSLLRRESPDNLWVKCPESGQLVFHKDLEANLMVVPGSGYHMAISAKARLASLFDEGDYEELPTPEALSDPLRFRDVKRYSDRLKENRIKTGAADAVTLAFGKLEDQNVTVAVQDFAFQGGTLGVAAGEAIIAGMNSAVERRTPFIIFTASGGARMQEGMFALMQMPRTTVAVRRLRVERLPYIVVLTNPTTGGVTASYAMLGDVHIAEPGAVIGFAGARVIEQTIRERLPEGFQRAEYLRVHGMVDMVVPRQRQREALARLCRLLLRAPAPA